MTAIGWDSPSTILHLADLHARQVRSRIKVSWQRIASPQRIVATSLAVLCLIGYAIAGLTILSQRTPVASEQLSLWLSGSMVVYALYHAMRSVWSTSITERNPDTCDTELGEAARLWLMGGPLRRSSILGYELIGSATQAVLKTILIAVILFHDVARLELLVTALFGSIFLLEIVRRLIDRAIQSLSPRTLIVGRVGLSLAALALATEILVNVSLSTPIGSPTGVYLFGIASSLGNVASSTLVQWLAFPWWSASKLAVADRYGAPTIIQFAATVCVVPLAMMCLALVDQHCWQRLSEFNRRLEPTSRSVRRWRQWTERRDSGIIARFRQRMDANLSGSTGQVMTLASRQCKSLWMHWLTVLLSLLIPVLLSLSPLLIDTTVEQWLFVVGGVMLSTLLLAPPALRLDFRRDVRRLSLLSSLPMTPQVAVIGQLWLPVTLTVMFQITTLAIAGSIVRPGWIQMSLWLGIMPSLAVIVFAAENAIFLAFPHRERAEGIAMVIRTKVIFLGKSLSLLLLLGLLVTWALVCRRWIPEALVGSVYVVTTVVGAAGIAGLAVRITSRVWRRFDCASDAPLG